MQKNRHIVLLFFRVVTVFVLLLAALFTKAQQQIVFDSAYIVMENSPLLVIDNPSATAIVNPGEGWIISEAEFNQVKWNIGSSAGNYIVPLGDSTTNYIPVTMNVTTAGDTTGSINFSTYHGPTWDNLTYMPTGVTNMHGNTVVDNSAKAVDRFWIIDAGSYATKPTSDVTFTYIMGEVTAPGNAITEKNLFVQRFNPTGATWADFYGSWGTDNSVLKTVSSGNVTPANLLRSWVLADNSGPMGVTPVTVQPNSITTCNLFDTSLTVVDTGIGMNFQWEVNPGSGFVNVVNGGVYSGATTPTLNITGATTSMSGYTYYCIIGNGMTSSDTVKLTVSPGPAVIATSSPNEICIGSNVSLSATGASTYTWLPSTGVSCNTCSVTTGTPTASTTYSVVGKDSIGCTDTTNVAVKVDTMPVAVVGGTQKMCEGGYAMLSASGGSSYSWSPSATLNQDSIADPAATPGSSTTYVVTIFNGACSVKDSEQVIVNPNPTGVTASGATTILIGNSAPISGSGPLGDSYMWIPTSSLSCDNCPDPVASPTTTTTYTLFVIDSNGCKTDDTVTIHVEDICGEVFVPGAFSPDGDGHNDILYVRGNCIKELDFIVYDRWGNKVFESNNRNIGWDGRYNGQAMNVGVYGYYVEATLDDGTKVQKKGNVGLVR